MTEFKVSEEFRVIEEPTEMRFKLLAAPAVRGICHDCQSNIKFDDITIKLESSQVNVCWVVAVFSYLPLTWWHPAKVKNYVVCKDCARRIELAPWSAVPDSILKQVE